MATYQEIRHQIETLSAGEQLQLLEELAAMVRHSMSAVVAGTDVMDSAANSAVEVSWAGMSALEAARRVIGVVGDGPADLSTNPIYMTGFGE